jgi:type VI secretion system secreted protein Hcp
MKRLLSCIALVAASALAHGPAAAAPDIFGKFTDIDGESIVKGHEKWIEVLSYSWGATNPASFSSGSGASAGKVEFDEFSFTKLYDRSSPVLLLDLAQGKQIEEALFDFLTLTGGATPEVYLQYKFSDVFMTSYDVAGSTGGGNPIESWSFTFGKVQTTYKPQDNKTGKLGAPVTFTWDVTGNMAPIPEPSTWAMLVAGLLFVVYFGRNRVRAREQAA